MTFLVLLPGAAPAQLVPAKLHNETMFSAAKTDSHVVPDPENVSEHNADSQMPTREQTLHISGSSLRQVSQMKIAVGELLPSVDLRSDLAVRSPLQTKSAISSSQKTQDEAVQMTRDA